MILLVASQVLGELSNAIGQDSDLNFRGTGILVVAMKIFDRLGLYFLNFGGEKPRALQVSVSTAINRRAGPVTGEIIPEKSCLQIPSVLNLRKLIHFERRLL